MDPQFTATREDLYHVQMDVKHVQAVQINHADRILKLEKRQADDAALKSVWGTSSPFPSVMGGTPQQGPIPNSAADVFDDFDDEQSQNLLGSLQLETDEEPVRRGASRANSVRFDVSALQGSNWAAGSRNSGEFGLVRPGSGFGSHAMTERSLSHRSDGRHSSAGHSVHSIHSASGRASSLGLDTNFLIGGQGDDSMMSTPDPPPGLFILGPVPSIIRCWLTTNFSHSALIYAALCTGSQRSVLDYGLVNDLGLSQQIRKDSEGRHNVRLPVYLPEAIITQPASRSNSPAPQLPALTVEFEITGLPSSRVSSGFRGGIRVFLGSDVLRAHNADILFSQNLMTIYGDDRNKLSVPFVRPEDENLFRNLCTANIPPERAELDPIAAPFSTEPGVEAQATADSTNSMIAGGVEKSVKIRSPERDEEAGNGLMSPFTSISTSDLNSRDRASSIKSNTGGGNGSVSDSEKQHQEAEASDAAASTDSARQESASGIWGSWRHGSSSVSNTENESVSGYQRATRGGRSMKVLKPSKSISSGNASSSRSTSAARTGAAYEPPAPSRTSGESRRKSLAENMPVRWDAKRTPSDDQKASKNIAALPRSSNPIGGASAFAWMNPGKPKTNASSGE